MHSPWIPIADLLAGFVVVLLLMFVGAAALPVLEAERAEQTEEAKRNAAFRGLAETLLPFEADGVLQVDVGGRRIELRDVSFESGSACLSDEARSALRSVADQVVAMLAQDPSLHVFFEGHTDPQPVGKLRNQCGWFADNTQLSAQRAQNVRDLLVESGPGLRKRLPVMGWGPDRLRNSESPLAPENRRVELRFAWLADGEGGTISARQP